MVMGAYARKHSRYHRSVECETDGALQILWNLWELHRFAKVLQICETGVMEKQETQRPNVLADVEEIYEYPKDTSTGVSKDISEKCLLGKWLIEEPYALIGHVRFCEGLLRLEPLIAKQYMMKGCEKSRQSLLDEYMYQISNEKFGLFVTELRKEKNLTQKDLAEKLYVSDKTVSKWERGLSMPNVVLLIPIADILDVTVTELLRGEKIDTQKNIDTKEVEELVVGSLDMAVRNSIHQHRKNWILAYLLCFLISITEIIMLVVSGNSIAEMKDDILLVTGLMLLFGAWFCFFAKDILPTYYDSNKINYVSQGIFRIHLVGLSFNNGNWMYICTTLKIWTLATVVLYPLAGIIIINCFNIALWNILNKIFLIMILGGMVVSIYIIGKKYE